MANKKHICKCNFCNNEFMSQSKSSKFCSCKCNISYQNNKRTEANLQKILGTKAGRLTIISGYLKLINGKNYLYCLCKCDCGSDADIAYSRIISGKTRSCGCISSERTSEFNRDNKRNPDRKDATSKALYGKYKSRAKGRNTIFDIPYDEFNKLIHNECFYCGSSNTLSLKDDASDFILTHNTVDRINSDLGYIDGNVITACYHCNIAKNSFPEQVFLSWIKQVHQHWVINKDSQLPSVATEGFAMSSKGGDSK